MSTLMPFSFDESYKLSFRFLNNVFKFSINELISFLSLISSFSFNLLFFSIFSKILLIIIKSFNILSSTIFNFNSLSIFCIIFKHFFKSLKYVLKLSPLYEAFLIDFSSIIHSYNINIII